MFRGLLMGVASGALVAGAGLSVASLVAPLPETEQTAEPAAIAQASPEQPAEAVAPEVEAEQPAEVETPEVSEPEMAEPEADQPAQAPVEQASETSGAPRVELQTEVEVLQMPSIEPQVSEPSSAPKPQASVVEPSQPMADTSTADAPQNTVIDTELSEPQAADDAGIEVTVEAPVLPSPQSEKITTPDNEANIVVSTESTVQFIVEDAPVEPAPEVVVVEDAAPEAETPMGVEEPEEPEVMAEPEPEPSPEPAPEVEVPEESDQQVAVLTPDSGSASGMPTGASNVTIRRIGEEPEPSAPSINALEEYGVDAPASDLPQMSVIVIDNGGLPSGPALLRSVPFPVTVGLEITDPDAAAKLMAYRNAGFEVIALTGMPDGASAGDAANVMEATFSILGESIGVLDDGQGGLTQNREVIGALMSRLASENRGFVTISQGLNAGQRAAEAEGVPSAIVSRDLDSEDQDAAVIRRFLDRSAFQARQQSGVVLIGRLRADTISALTLWAGGSRAEQVSLVPVSNILKAQ